MTYYDDFLIAARRAKFPGAVMKKSTSPYVYIYIYTYNYDAFAY